MDKLDKIATAIRRKNEIADQQTRSRIDQAEAEIDRLRKRFLDIDPDMEAMILFGSLATQSVRSIDFDVDIAVKSQHYLKLLAEALNSPFKVDLVDLDTIDKHIKQRIDQTGKLIYEKE